MNKFVSLVRDRQGRSSLDFLGDEVHHLWYSLAPGRIDRRELMRRVATELLWHLGDDREIAEGATTVDQQLLNDALHLTFNPENLDRKLLADALFSALLLIGSKDDLAAWHEGAGRVYGPLMKLAGLRMATVANSSKPRRLTISDWQLQQHKNRYIRDHGGSVRGWVKEAAAEFRVSTKTISRRMQESPTRKRRHSAKS